MQDLLDIMRQLRAPGGCAWDQAQTHESLRPYLLEEAAEAADAVGCPAQLADELGDVLLQVAFHSVIAEEEGTFNYADVQRTIVEKMIRRHPHVFSGLTVSGQAEIASNWQSIKAAEHADRPRSAAERVPTALGALARETKTQVLSAALPGGRAAVVQAASEADDTEAGVAEVLSSVVAWARSLGLDAEVALRGHTARTLSQLEPQL